MTDLLSNLPLELRGQILSLSRNDALAQMAIVSRTLSNDAINVLYSDIDGPWPLIQLLEIESRAEFLKDGFILQLPISESDICRLKEKASLAHSFRWREDALRMCTECAANAAVHVYDQLTTDLLPNLQFFGVSCLTSHGVMAAMPWLSRSAHTLDISFGPDVDDLAVISSLLHVQRLCAAVKSFTLTLDTEVEGRRFGTIDALSDAISAMMQLRTVSLPSDLVTIPVLDALVELPHLQTFTITSPMVPVVWDTPNAPSTLLMNSYSNNNNNNSAGGHHLDALSPLLHLADLPQLPSQAAPLIETSRFYALHNLRTSAGSWRETLSVAQTAEVDFMVNLSGNPDERARTLRHFAHEHIGLEI